MPRRRWRKRAEVLETDDTGVAFRPRDEAPTTVGPAQLVLGRYRLHRRLGAGAFGVVWEAHDEHLDRPVAVKRITCHDQRIAARAEREARAAARLSHPGIVALYEAREQGDAVFLVSELVRGKPLDELSKARALSDRDLVRIGIALCDALQHAHTHGVIHRDIKPANILIPRYPQNEHELAKLTDFGVAHMAGDATLTAAGDVVGTIAYMSPEQAEGDEITPATDLYALGIVLYEALARHNPIRAGGAATTARRVGMQLPQLDRTRPDLPAALTEAIDRAVEPDPLDRGELSELREGLEQALDSVGRELAARPYGADPTALHGLPGRGSRRRRGRLDADLQPLDPDAGAHTYARSRRPDVVDPDAPLSARLVARFRGASVGLLATAAVLAFLGAGAPADGGAAILPACAAAALALLLLPRAGAVLVAAALVAWLADSGSPGIAVLLAVAIATSALALPRDGDLWALPALAPLLALVGCALAWPAIAGQARGGVRRAALGALGAWWIALAEPLARGHLLLGDVPDAPGRDAWEHSSSQVFDGIVSASISHGVVLIALVWALAAWCLPLLVRGWNVLIDLVFVTAWVAGLTAATLAAAQSLPWSPAPVVAGLTAGVPLAAVLALVAAGARPRSDAASRGRHGI